MPIIKKKIASRMGGQICLHLVCLVCFLFAFTDLTSAQNSVQELSQSQQNADSLISLTAQEQAWLAAHPDIQLGYTDAFEPEVIVNPDGSHSGILVDFLDELNRRLGTQIGLHIDSIPGILQKAQAKEVDGILEMHPEYADKLGLLKSVGYLRAYPAVFARQNVSFENPADFAGKKIAIIDKVYFTEKMVREYGEQSTILRVKDAIQGMKSVSDGDADLYIGVSFNSYYITKYQLFDVVIKYVFYDFSDKFGMAVRPDWPELVPILNKGIASFSQNEIDAIVAKWIHLPQQEGQVELTAEERAWLKEHPIITLGGGNFPPLDFFDETKGQSDGVGPDYAKLIGSMLGVKFKLVSGDWQDIQNMAKSKQIDGIRLIFKSKVRENYLNYTKPLLTIAHAIVMKKETEGASSLKELSHKRVGTMQGLYTYHYVKEHYPDLDLITYPTWEKVLRALVNNEVEAVVGTLPVITHMTNKLFLTNLKVTALPPEMEREAYLGIRPDWPELSVIINKAIDAITIEQHSEIKQKWVALDTEDKEDQISLTPKEQAWLDQDHAVQVRVVNLPPYMILNKGAAPTGISIDYLKLIGERSGVKFKYTISGDTFPESLEGLRKHQGPDLITSIVRTPEREKSVIFSRDYARSPYVIFTHTGNKEFIADMTDLRGKKIALPKGWVIHEKVKSEYPELKLVLFDNSAQAIEAVTTRKADAYIGNLTSASFIIQEKGFVELKIAGPSPFGDQVFSMGIRNDWPELGSIIDKVLASISPEEQAAIRNKYISIQYQHTEKTVIIKWILIIGGAASTIIFFFVFWNRQLRRKVQERTAEVLEREERFRVTFQQAAVGISHVGIDGQFLRINQKFCDITGYSQNEIINLNFQDITHPEDLEKDLDNVQQLLNGKIQNYSMEKRYICKNSETVWINLTVSLLRDDTGKPSYFVAVIVDISKRKLAEEKIKEHQERLKALASQLTIAEEKERSRIATELHDHIGQTLAFSRIQVANAKKYAEDGKLTTILDEISQSLLGCIKDTKELVFDLSSPMLKEIGLAAAISNWLEEQVGIKHGIGTEFIDDNRKRPLTSDLRAILFRNVRELLANVIRHAKATKVSVSLESNEQYLKITVQDDGVGFNPEEVSGKVAADTKFGLFSIRERMEDFGGSFEIISSPGSGCRSVLTVPFSSNNLQETT